MSAGSRVRYAAIAAAIVALGLLGFAVVQLEHIEERLVVQGQQIRALGEATDRLLSHGVKAGPRAAAAAAPEDEQPAKVLHPEVPNFLKPRDKRWPAPGARTDGVLTRDWPSGDLKSFNPLVSNDGELAERILPYVVVGLADRNVWTNPNDWHGELATRVEITDDFKEFTLYLRKGVKWHPVPADPKDPKYAWLQEPRYVTAQDVVFATDMIMNPQVENGFLKNYYKEFESAKALDDHTLVIRWKKKEYLNLSNTLSLFPIPEFLYAHEEDGRPIPKETLGLRFNRHWLNNKAIVGAGPYRMVSYEPGARMRFQRNEDFYGDKPAIKEVVFSIYTDPQTTLLKLKAHELGVGGLQPGQYREEIKQFEGAATKPKNSPFLDGRIQCEKVSRFAFFFIGWNAEKPLFADKRVRRAMTLALDRQSMVDSVFVGLGKVAVGPFLPESPNNDPEIRAYPFDSDGARKLLSEAGWTDTDGDGLVDKALQPGDARRLPFEFTLLLQAGRKEWTALANIFKENLVKLGVKLNIDAAEWSLMQKRMNEKRFDAYVGGYGIGWDGDMFQIWHSSQASIPQGSNRVGFRSKEADEIIETLRRTFPENERTALLRRFHRIVHDEQPYTFVISPTRPTCWWSEVKDVVFAKIDPATVTLPWSVAQGSN